MLRWDWASSSFKAVPGIAGLGYHITIMPDTHMPWIFLGGSLFFLVAFIVLCLNVKEGQYPPPPPNDGRRGGMFSGIKKFGKECFSHRIYWFYYLHTGFVGIAFGCLIFNIFLQQNMGLTLTQIGNLGGIVAVGGLLLYPLGGILADRYHPFRTLMLVSTLQLIFFTPIGLIWIFAHPSPHTYYMVFLFTTLANVPLVVLEGASGLPNEMRLFPKERYGQFSSANAAVRSILSMLGGVAAGAFIDLVKKMYGGSDFAYRYGAVWNCFFMIFSWLFLFLCYREWKKWGGATSYVPPEVDVPDDQTSTAPVSSSPR